MKDLTNYGNRELHLIVTTSELLYTMAINCYDIKSIHQGLIDLGYKFTQEQWQYFYKNFKTEWECAN